MLNKIESFAHIHHAAKHFSTTSTVSITVRVYIVVEQPGLYANCSSSTQNVTVDDKDNAIEEFEDETTDGNTSIV